MRTWPENQRWGDEWVSSALIKDDVADEIDKSRFVRDTFQDPRLHTQHLVHIPLYP